MEVSRVIEILCEYRGQPVPAEEVEIVPDLQILDLYAARVGGSSDYLVHADSGAVEEVDFDGWPPAPAVRSQTAERGESAVRVGDLMSREVYYCRSDDTLDRAALAMWEHDCGCVPVCVDNGAPQVVGMLTDRDICMAALFQGRPLSEIRAYEAMSRDVRACKPSDAAARVERLMRDRQIRRVPVVDGQRHLIGIVSLADLARAATPSGSALSSEEVSGTLAAICRPGAMRPSA